MRCTALLALAIGCNGELEPPGEPTRVSAKAPERCTLRIAARGIYVDGEPVTQSEAVQRCARTAGAMVIVEDDAGSWKSIHTELVRRRVRIYMRGPVGDVDCADNPLARDCR